MTEERVLKISDSSLGTFRSCPRKFEFGKIYKTGGGGTSLAAEVGKVLHTGYQSWLQGRLIDMPDAEARDYAVWKMMQIYPWQMNMNPADTYSMEACYATFNHMMESAPVLGHTCMAIDCLDGAQRAAIEVPFEVTLTGIDMPGFDRVAYIGYIDCILYDKSTDEITVVDIKTSRSNMHDKTAMYCFHEQCLPYGLVLERMLGNELTSMTVKYLSVYVDMLNPSCEIYSFHKSQLDIRDWARNVWFQLQNMQQFLEMTWWPRNGSACTNWNRTCGYFDICPTRSPQAIKSWIECGELPARPDREMDPWIKLELELAA